MAGRGGLSEGARAAAALVGGVGGEEFVYAGFAVAVAAGQFGGVGVDYVLDCSAQGGDLLLVAGEAVGDLGEPGGRAGVQVGDVYLGEGGLGLQAVLADGQALDRQVAGRGLARGGLVGEDLDEAADQRARVARRPALELRGDYVDSAVQQPPR